MNIANLAQRSTLQRSLVLRRKSKVTKSMCKMLCSPSRNPVRKQPFEAQILYHNIPVKKRQLQRMLKRHIKGGWRQLCAFVKKTISTKNRQERGQYGQDLSTILSLVFLIISSIQMKHTSTLRHKLGVEYFESKRREINQRISKRGHRLRVSGFTLPHRSVGKAKHLSYASTMTKKTQLSVLRSLGNLVGV